MAKSKITTAAAMTAQPGNSSIGSNPQPRSVTTMATTTGATGKTMRARIVFKATMPKLEYQRTAFDCVNGRLGAITSQIAITANTPKKKLSLTVTSLFNSACIFTCFPGGLSHRFYMMVVSSSAG